MFLLFFLALLYGYWHSSSLQELRWCEWGGVQAAPGELVLCLPAPAALAIGSSSGRGRQENLSPLGRKSCSAPPGHLVWGEVLQCTTWPSCLGRNPEMHHLSSMDSAALKPEGNTAACFQAPSGPCVPRQQQSASAAGAGGEEQGGSCCALLGSGSRR